MRDNFLGQDRLDIRVDGATLTWVLLPRGNRVLRAAIWLAILATIMVAVPVNPAFLPIAVALFVLNVWIGRRNKPQVLTGPVAISAALQAVSGVGREVWRGHWQVDGPDAAPLAVQLAQWQEHGVTAPALEPEPQDVTAESYLDGEPWPAPPETIAEPWPVWEQRPQE